MSFDLLIFDCDGVLIDSEWLAVGAMRDVLQAAGVPATTAMVLDCVGMKQADALAQIGRTTGRAIPAEVQPQLWPATRAAFEQALAPMPGVVEILQRSGATRRCVASSSSPERMDLSLALTGLRPFFGDWLFSSHQVSRGKPAPDLFLLAAARMGVDPSRCAVIEDSQFGIVAARAAGMAAFGFAGGSHCRPGHADRLRAAGAHAVAPDWPAMVGLLAP